MGGILNSLIAITLVIVGFLIQQRRRRDVTGHQRGSCEPLIQHQPLEPFIGLDFLLTTRGDMPLLYRLHQKYGNIFQVNTLVGLPAIYTIAPENVKLMNTIDHEWGIQPTRLPGMEYFCGRGFLTMDGEISRHSRKLLKPSFAKSNISDMGILSREVDKLLAQLPKEGTTVDLQPLLYIMFLNTSLYFLLSIYPDDEQQEAPYTPEEFVNAFHEALFWTAIRMVLGKGFRFVPQTKYIRSCEIVHRYLDFYIDQGINLMNAPSDSDQIKQKNIIQGLASQTDDGDFIRSQIIQGMMASQETTSALLGNTFFLLARHPRYWKEIRAEVFEKGDDILNCDALLNSKTLHNILMESVRLYPVFPLMGRVALCDTTLPVGGGPDQDAPFFVPKGTLVHSNYFALHREPNLLGDDVEAFKPERWDNIDPGQWGFMGFGGGSRACLGRQKSLIEAAYMIVRMAREFEKLESRDDKPWKSEMKLTCKNANGSKVAFYKA